MTQLQADRLNQLCVLISAETDGELFNKLANEVKDLLKEAEGEMVIKQQWN